MGQRYRGTPLGAESVPAPYAWAMDLRQDVLGLATALVDFPSVSHNEAGLADAVEAALRVVPHLTVTRNGNTVIARTQLGRGERVIIGGHLDTVPSSGNDRARLVRAGEPAPVADASGSLAVTEDRLYGLGSCDMKGGVAVQLRLAAGIEAPTRDVTYCFYECEEIEAEFNGLKRIAEEQPELLAADFAVLMEPSNAIVEAGCQGTMRIEIRTQGRRAHTARSWMGDNAIHALGDAFDRLRAYEPRRVVIDGLEYREGLQAVRIDGGVAGNVVPDAACLTVNYRHAPSRSSDEAEAHLRELFVGYDIVVTDRSPGAMPGLTQPAARAFVAATGGAVEPKFGWTDVARFSALGIPAVNFGPGDPTLAHAPNEFVPVADLLRAEEQLTRWLLS